MLSTQAGFQNLLKEGFRHYAGLEEAILRNIDACKETSNLTKTSFGPNGMKKMVVNHLEKIFVTSDASTILKEIEIQHPAAKLIAMASKMQIEDYGDMSNTVVTLTGELLTKAEMLIKTGLHPSNIILGYEIALKECLNLLENMTFSKSVNLNNKNEIINSISSVLAPKLPIYHELFSKLITEGCLQINKENSVFKADNIRILKILGGNANESSIFSGIAINRDAYGIVKFKEKPKVVCYSCPFDLDSGDTKGTILLKNANELLNYNSTEEKLYEEIVKEIVNAGIDVVVVGGTIGELIQHYFDKYNVMTVKVLSKFELKRISNLVGGIALSKVVAPTPEEIGYCSKVEVKEISSQKIIVFDKNEIDSKFVTIVVRGSTNSLLDDIERAIDNGVNLFNQILKDNKFIPGAGSTEAYLSNMLSEKAALETGLEQYSFLKFAESFEVIPKILSDNAGLNSNEAVPEFLSKNIKEPKFGINVLYGKITEEGENKILDHFNSKINAIKLAVHVTLTILRIDQIIIAKPSGGPKPPSTSGWDNKD